MVTITVADKDYPLELLKAQSQKMASILGSEARGLSVMLSGSDPKFKFVKANFATDGIIDRENGVVRLEAIVRAMLGVPAPHTISAFLITLENEAPVEKQSLQTFSSDAVVLRAHASENPKGLEYRIVALTQDPEKVTIPGRFNEPERKVVKEASPHSSGPGWVPLALIVVAGASGGALVYFALSGRSSRGGNRPAQRT